MFGRCFLTLCRNLQSTGRVSLPSFCSTIWVRVSRETFSLQLHTAELWIREFRGSEAKKRRGSPNTSFMIGLAEMRESARMNVFASFKCLSKCCGGEDDRRKQHFIWRCLTNKQKFLLKLDYMLYLFPFRINSWQKTFLPSAEVWWLHCSLPSPIHF